MLRVAPRFQHVHHGVHVLQKLKSCVPAYGHQATSMDSMVPRFDSIEAKGHNRPNVEPEPILFIVGQVPISGQSSHSRTSPF
jgi:hypothetical protein